MTPRQLVRPRADTSTPARRARQSAPNTAQRDSATAVRRLAQGPRKRIRRHLAQAHLNPAGPVTASGTHDARAVARRAIISRSTRQYVHDRTDTDCQCGGRCARDEQRRAVCRR